MKLTTIKLLLGFSFLSLLSACMVAPPQQAQPQQPAAPAPAPEPLVFGVPQSTWKNLSSKERQQVIAGYNKQQILAQQQQLQAQQQQAQDAENQRIDDMVNVAGNIINSAITKNNN
jgi:hypothetical protein